MAPLKVYWWRPPTSGKINLGDEINGTIVEAVSGRRVLRSTLGDCDLLAIGSVLSFPSEKKVFEVRSAPIHVWGSGLIEPTKLGRQEKLICAALRGPLTRCLIDVPSSLPLGDPALFVPEIWPAAREKLYSVGIVPHHSQMNSPYVAEWLDNNPRATLIDFTDRDVNKSLHDLSACDLIISSSLHGLIIADAYGIPNAWLNAKNVHRGNSWKFYDYFASVGRTSFEPVNFGTTSLADFVHGPYFSFAKQDRIAAMRECLRASFPSI